MSKWRPWALFVVLAAALCLAFALPWAAFPDCACGLTDLQRERLKSQAELRLGFPVLRLQVQEAAAISSDLDAGQGTIAVRGPFGVKTGEVEVLDSGDITRSLGLEAGLWGILGLVTVGGILAGRYVWSHAAA